MAKQTTPAPAAPVVSVEEQIAQLLSTKAVSSGSKNVALEFEKVAKANNHVVTFAQAKEISPKSPSDAAFYFRQALGKVTTSKQKDGKTCWIVMKLPNGKMGYPNETKALLAELKAQQAPKPVPEQASEQQQ